MQLLGCLLSYNAVVRVFGVVTKAVIDVFYVVAYMPEVKSSFPHV